MTYHILYNPLAGHGDQTEKVSALSAKLQADTVTHDITKLESYASLANSLTSDDAIILCGGDGTINRFVNDTQGINFPCDILYYPMGTGNDFLHDLGKTQDDAPISLAPYIQNLPTVEVNGRTYKFLNNVGFGIDGYCTKVGDEMKKASDKPVNYTAIAIKGLLFHYRPTNAVITVDGQTFAYKKVWLAPTMKGRYYGGGMMATPAQDRNNPSGELSVMLFYGKGRLSTLMAFPSIFKGEHIKHKNMVVIHTGHDIHVKFDAPTPLQIDGETILGVTEYRATARVSAPVEASV